MISKVLWQYGHNDIRQTYILVKSYNTDQAAGTTGGIPQMIWPNTISGEYPKEETFDIY